MSLIVTVDIDWAPEWAIEKTLDFFFERGVTPTVFSTHPSPFISRHLDKMEVGLHPYFGRDSSQGVSVEEVVQYVMELPHNLPIYRSHRFLSCNSSKEAMKNAGMRGSSNVCSDLEVIPPFKDRFGLWEIPIFLEDGGYLFRQHPLEMNDALLLKLQQKGDKVLVVHPMHFVVNTPYFSYMVEIKRSLSRLEWNTLSSEKIKDLEWKQRGIRDLLIDILNEVPQGASMRDKIA